VNGDAPADCVLYGDDLAELALGVLTGAERAKVLGHVEQCPRCALELAELAAVADHLAREVHEAEPPAGFELRVLDRIRGEPTRRSIRSRRGVRVAVAIAAAAAVVAGAFVTGRATTPSRPSNGLVGGSTAVSGGEGLRVAELTSADRSLGEVYAYSSGYPWVLMTIAGLPPGSEITCTVTTVSGRTIKLGSFWLSTGSGAWASQLPVSVGRLRSAAVVAAGGAVLARATFAA